MPPQEYTGPEAELTSSLIGMAMKVHSYHGPGLDERTYENSMCIDMAEAGLEFTQQEQFNVTYKGHQVSKLLADLIVNRAVILENKVVSAITDVHVSQLLSYLAVTRLQVGLILNFAKPSLEIRRIVRSPLGSQSEESP